MKKCAWAGWKFKNLPKGHDSFRVQTRLYFSGPVPDVSRNFGIKTYGKVHNEFLADCAEKEWCDVDVSGEKVANSSGGFVTIIFNSINESKKNPIKIDLSKTFVTSYNKNKGHGDPAADSNGEPEVKEPKAEKKNKEKGKKKVAKKKASSDRKSEMNGTVTA